LVELLVVIGIIAVLIAILLPVINKSRQASITLKCETQLRQMYHGLSMYAVDNKGRLPWGQYRAVTDLTTQIYVHGISQAPPQNVVTWQSIINQYFNPKAPNTLFYPGTPDGAARSSYVCNMVAMPDKDYEEDWVKYSGTNQPVLQPAQLGKLYPHNVLLFDTGAVINSEAMYVT